jgi:predicted secreted Zn-dependent protease
MRARRGRSLAIAALAGATVCSGAAVTVAEPAFKETIIHYPVTGRTIPEVLDSIARNGPKSEKQGSATVGRTIPKFSWSWTLAASPRECRIASANVALAVTIRMPRWQDRDRSPAPLRAEWDRYYADVLKHERGHAEISKATSRMIERAILALPARSTCPQMRDAIRPAVEALVRTHDAEQEAFDVKEGSCNLRKSCLGRAGVPAR